MVFLLFSAPRVATTTPGTRGMCSKRGVLWKILVQRLAENLELVNQTRHELLRMA
jgi:hypothetical protein